MNGQCGDCKHWSGTLENGGTCLLMRGSLGKPVYRQSLAFANEQHNCTVTTSPYFGCIMFEDMSK